MKKHGDKWERNPMKTFQKILAVLVAGLAVFALAASGESEGGSSSGDAKQSEEAAEAADVKVDSCAKDSTMGFPEASLTIVNNSAKPSDYIIEISFTSPDGAQNYGTGNAIVQRLEPKQTKTEKVSALDNSAGANPFICKVSKVSRTASL